MSTEKIVKTGSNTVAKNAVKSAPTDSSQKIQTTVTNSKNKEVVVNNTIKNKQTKRQGLEEFQRSYSNYSEQTTQHTSYHSSEPIYIEDTEEEEEYVEGQPYKVSEFEQRRLQKEAEEEKSKEVNKKVEKAAVKAVATYYGGTAGNMIAGAVNDSGILDPVYDAMAKRQARMNKLAPGGRMGQKILNKLDDEGIVDEAANVLDSIGSKGGNAAQNAGKNAAQQAGSQAQQAAQKKAAAEAANNAAKKQATHAAAEKAEGTSKRIKSKIMTLIMTHPWIFIAGGAIIFLFLIIFLVILGGAGSEAEQQEAAMGYMDPAYDFTETDVTLTNNYNNINQKIEVEHLSLAELADDDLSHLSDEEKIELYKTMLIVGKTLALSIGNYDSSTKEITIQSGSNGLPYCDIDNGCKVIENNGTYTYISGNYSGNFTGKLIKTIGPLSENDKSLLIMAYNQTKYEIITPKNVNEALTAYTYGKIDYNQKLVDEWIDAASEGETYKQIIEATDEYKGKKIYNVEDYSMYYNYSSGTTYWWPIGGSKEENGIYSGKPTVTYVSSKYGMRTINGKTSMHSGIDIAGACQSNVIIATRSGTVTKASDGCASMGSYGSSCGGGYGNYVIVDHGDGTSSVYAHMYKNSVSVKAGDKVRQGQKLGLIGSSGSSTGCHLHFEIRVNGQRVDPLQYISAENPRSVSDIGSGYAQGGNNQQTVCLSLKQSGFSNNAVAALLVNIRAESNFNPSIHGDSGTSYGLCQWHKGRYTNLKNFCGGQYSTIKCQISYLIYELQNSYKGVYNYLRSNNSAWNMADYFCQQFERPANKQQNCPKRANNFVSSYSAYVANGCR